MPWKTKLVGTKPAYCAQRAEEFVLGEFDVATANKEQWTTTMHSRIWQRSVSGNIETLPNGIYNFVKMDYEPWLVQMDLDNSELILDLKHVNAIAEDFTNFSTKRNLYQELNLKHKKGILLYGPPGTGKTSTIHKLIQEIRPENSLVIFMHRRLDSETRELLNADPRLKIFILEELTEICASLEWGMRELLNFLDGENSLSHSFIVGTTNYPEKLPSNIVDRPGRFDKLFKINYLGKDEIKTYAENKLNRPLNTEEFVELTSIPKPTVAAIKELLLLHLRDNLTIKQAATNIKEHKKLAENEFSETRHIGFDSWED